MPIHPRRIVLRTVVILLLLTAWTTPARPAAARLGSDPLAIIAAVNALRAAHNLPPYTIDQGLMNFALEHSRYQASIHLATHSHSDGSTVWQHGMDENIATGMLGYLTPEFAVYTIWADAIHMKTMVGYATGSVGAGVADDGQDEYYTLEVRPGNAVSRPTTGAADPKVKVTPTKIIPIVPLLTVTPRADRWIIHTVGYGQSLWAVAIAYGVKMDMIRAWNSMAEDSTDIYAGQKLYIIAPPSIWPTLTASPEGGPGIANTGQTVTPGYSVTEEPAAATQKAAYQATAALSEGSNPQETDAPAAVAMAATASATPAPQSLAASTGSGPAAQAVQPSKAAEGDNLPLVAGVLILVGGALLVVIAFSMVKGGRG